MQGSILLLGAGLSLALTLKIGRAPFVRLAPQCLLIASCATELGSLVVQ